MEGTNETTVRKEVSKSEVSVDKVYKGEYQKEGTMTAQLRQTVKTDTFYPSKQVSNSHQDNPFSLEEFGFSETKYENQEQRVAWLDIPQGLSVEDVLGRIPAEACLYKILSNRPILTDSQNYAIEQELRTLDNFADSQIVRYGENHEKAGQIVPDANGKPQYRAVFFSSTAKEDIDLRDADPVNSYASDAIKAEMQGAGAIINQSL